MENDGCATILTVSKLLSMHTNIYTGLPNLPKKLPSRNWMIFFTVTGTWTAAVLYDRREKKKIQKKWARVVEHIAKEPLDVSQLPRKMTVYISAPPMDGLLIAREHFVEYVKPILVSAALDWDAVEGRREGDVRAGLAERIRKLRKRRGERGSASEEDDFEDSIEEARKRAGVREWDGTQGDIVIGRHTWKEYVRGMHEGWLGPLDPPTKAEDAAVPLSEPAVASLSAGTETTPTVESKPLAEATASLQDVSPLTNTAPIDDASPAAVPESEKPKEEEKPKTDEKKPKKKQPPPFNTTSDYMNSLVSPNCPQSLGPTAIIPFPHLLGFLNFPIRMYRFLNRRQVADDIGRETAAAVLAVYRPFEMPTNTEDEAAQWEQQRLLANEESEWPKAAWDRKEDNGKERPVLDDMVLDPRIAERMRKFVLDMEAEERAKRVASEKGDAWWKGLWPKKEGKKAWEGLVEE